jgi:hypothetical protein
VCRKKKTETREGGGASKGCAICRKEKTGSVT